MSGASIFISVAAYCDPMLAFTLASARAQARHPERVFIGVVEQTFAGQGLHLNDEWSGEHLRWTRVDALEARGPCWARSLATALYQGEDGLCISTPTPGSSPSRLKFHAFARGVAPTSPCHL